MRPAGELDICVGSALVAPLYVHDCSSTVKVRRLQLTERGPYNTPNRMAWSELLFCALFCPLRRAGVFFMTLEAAMAKFLGIHFTGSLRET